MGDDKTRNKERPPPKYHHQVPKLQERKPEEIMMGIGHFSGTPSSQTTVGKQEEIIIRFPSYGGETRRDYEGRP